MPRDRFRMGSGSKLKIEIIRGDEGNERGGGQPKRPTPGGGPDEGYIERVYRPDDLLIPPKRPTVKYLDLGTRIVPEEPYSYREIEFYRPMQYSWASQASLGPNYFASVEQILPTGVRAEWEGLILAGDPFGQTKIEGRDFPNVLQLNHPSVFGQASVEFLNTDAVGQERGPFPLYDPLSEENWKWVPTEVDGAKWSADVTEQDLAPNTGQYVMQKKRPYNQFYAYDPRHRDFRFFRSGPFDKITASPSFDAEAVAPKLQYPLLIFGIPQLFYPVEVTGTRATQLGEPSNGPTAPSEYAFAAATCTIQEYYVGHLMRAPQVPTPYVGSPEDWLAHVPEQYEGLTIKRKAFRAEGVANYYHPSNMPRIVNVPLAITWEIFPGRRPRPLEEIQAEARDRVVSDVLKPEVGPVRYEDTLIPLGFVSAVAGPEVGHLRGIVEMKGKLYYVWRAL